MAKKRKKILCVVGARPNFMKVAPILKELRRYGSVDPILLHTGQHYDREMSKVFFEDLRLPRPDIYLGVGSCSQTVQVARIMTGLEDVLIKEEPKLVIVVGDVNSTLAAALAAAKLFAPIAHVEAGLRSFDRTMPEEVNRVVTDSLSEFLFTPSRDADENLLKEGIAREKIHFVGNVMIDTLMEFRNSIRKNKRALDRAGVRGRDFAVATLHRPSNVDRPEEMRRILTGLSAVQNRIAIVFPMHPRTKFFIKKFGLGKELSRMKNVKTIEPLGYLDFLTLLDNSRFVITDSGGIQEETTVLGVPCLTVRKNTERPVTVREGTNKIVGTDPAVILKESMKILNGKGKAGRIPEYWDGKAAGRIAGVLSKRGAL